MISFFAKLKIFRFWPKTMDYSQAFWPKLRSFFAILLLLAGRCYEAEICAILLPLRCSFKWYPFFGQTQNFQILAETMDYSQAFWPKLRSFFAILLLLAGRCYETETCAILLPLRCSFKWYPKLKIFRFWPKTMDYSQAFWLKLKSFFAALLLLAGRCYEAEICAILLPLRCSFKWYPFLPNSNFSDSGRKPWTIVRRFGRN